ncbi:hypothetical protein HMPREF0497_2316 [Lentilactobacillus buchneri ATCC 11577]|nr:hypothetical protein HMPREF0497_2316 [Lentilactobacillus buchneri ATCC 11577]
MLTVFRHSSALIAKWRKFCDYLILFGGRMVEKIKSQFYFLS